MVPTKVRKLFRIWNKETREHYVFREKQSSFECIIQNFFSMFQSVVKSPLGRPRSRWEDNNNMDLEKHNVRVWNVFKYIRTGFSGKPL